jgi:heptosyltransferase-1
MSGPRFLVVKTSSMGDVVHALPVVSDIARAFPGAAIDWVVEESFAAIPRLHPAVTSVIPIALRRWRRSLWRPATARTTWRELRTARYALRKFAYDAVVDCQGLLKSAVVARCAHGVHYGPDRHSARESLAALLYDRPLAVDPQAHAIARNRRLGALALGYALQGPPRFALAPAAADDALLALTQPGAYAVLLTNASRATKLWPDERWRAVEEWLAGLGLRSVLFWGGAEEGERTRARAAGMRNAIVAPPLALDRVATVLKQARLVIGLDTGLAHLAAALAVPTVGIFCDYDPALVGITGDASCASLGGVDTQPTVDEVIAAAQRVLAESEPRVSAPLSERA